MSAETKREEIATGLRALIASSGPGDPLPSERELAERHSASRETVRRALDIVTHEGLITPGKGTQPRTVASHDPIAVHVTRDADTAWPGESPTPGADAWVGDMQRAGQRITQDIEVTRPLAGPRIGRLLEISDLDVVTARRLARCAAGLPHNLITFWFPLSVAAGTPLEHPDSITEGSLGWLEKHHGPLAHQKPEISARMPSPAEAAQLRIGPGVPVLVVRRSSRDSARTVVCSVAIYPADRTVLLGP